MGSYPTPTNITGFGSMAQYVNSVDGNFFNLLLVTLWVVFYMGFASALPGRPQVAFTAASWCTFGLALLLTIVGIVHSSALLWSLIASVVGIIWTLTSET